MKHADLSELAKAVEAELQVRTQSRLNQMQSADQWLAFGLVCMLEIRDRVVIRRVSRRWRNAITDMPGIELDISDEKPARPEHRRRPRIAGDGQRARRRAAVPGRTVGAERLADPAVGAERARLDVLAADVEAREARGAGPVCESNLQLDFDVSVFECFDTSASAVLRELDESHRSVQKSAESTSM